MSFTTEWAIFTPAIAGNLFYSWREGNWWVLKAKFPRRAGHIVKITCTGTHPTNCHSEEGQFGNNIGCTQRNKYGPRLKRGSHVNATVDLGIYLTEARDITFTKQLEVLCANFEVVGILKGFLLRFRLWFWLVLRERLARPGKRNLRTSKARYPAGKYPGLSL